MASGDALHHDVTAYAVGIGVPVWATWLADLSTVSQQLTVIFGCLVVFTTLIHRCFLFYRDYKSSIGKKR